MAHLEEMPLLPLHSVLFPYAPMQLHVFEDRTREMVRSCLEFDAPLGVVLIRHGEELDQNVEPYMVGTAANIHLLKTYDDEKMDVQIYGARRFRIRKLDETKPYLVGMVEPLGDGEPEDENRLHALTIRAEEAFRQWIVAAFQNQDFTVQVQFPEDPLMVSFLVANYLPLVPQEKQLLLELTDTAERLSMLIPLIERHLQEARSNKYYRVESSQLRNWVSSN